MSKTLRNAISGLLACCMAIAFAGQTQAQIVGTLQELQDGGEVIGIRLTVSGSLNTDVLGEPNRATGSVELASGSRLLSGSNVGNFTYLSCVQGELNSEPRRLIERWDKQVTEFTTTGSANLLAINNSAPPTFIDGPKFYFSAKPNFTTNGSFAYFDVDKEYVSGSEINGTYDFLDGPFGYLGAPYEFRFAKWGINIGDSVKNSWTIDGVDGSITLIAGEPINLGNTAPIAVAGEDFSVNEGQSVMLDGSASIDLDDDPLTYAWAQVSGPTVTLSDASAAQPTFSAPQVAIGGETISFDLIVMANGDFATDTVNVTVVNVNHPPVADAGDDQSVAEGALATLNGEDSFDIDNDQFSYSWVQVSGAAVTLIGETTANPTFVAPFGGGGGEPGVVDTLVFELTVDDGFPSDAPAPGYEIGDVVDSVTVNITNVNNDPTAEAGNNQTVDENSAVALEGNGSDPDGDSLTYHWSQIDGTAVTISDAETATPSFKVPFVAPGGEVLTFKLTVNDGFGGSATDIVDVHVQNANDPPLISAAVPSQSVLWPPKHGMVEIRIDGVSDPDNNAMITIDSVTQDEPTNGQGDGDTEIDAVINGDGTVFIRAERAGNGNGRVYHIHFTAFDDEGSASGVVTVSVPHKKKQIAIDGGETFDSTQ